MSSQGKSFLIAPYGVEGVENASISDCFDYIKNLKVMGIDIETCRKFARGLYNENVYKGGLDPYLSDIVMLQIGDINNRFVIDTRAYTIEELTKIIQFLNYNNDVELVGHNLKFECKHLRHKYGIRFKNVWDTMVTEIVLTNGMNLRYGLADLSGRYLGINKKEELLIFDELYTKAEITLDQELLEEYEHMITPFEAQDSYEIDKSTRLEFVTIGDRPFNTRQVLYGADDIIHPLLIRERQKIGRRISDNDVYYPKLCIKIENSFTQVLGDVELQGMDVDQKQWTELAETNTYEYYKRKYELDQYVCKLFPTYSQEDLFSVEYEVSKDEKLSTNTICQVQWSSPKQCVGFLRFLDLCPRAVSKQTGREEWTSGAKELVKTLPNKYKNMYMKNKWVPFEYQEDGTPIRDDKKMVLAMLNLSKSSQAITTFGLEWLKYIHPITNKVHTSYRQILNTGRISSTNPNMQQIPGNQWRKPFIVGEGEEMICLDYSAQELRILADKAQEQNMLDFFIKGDPLFGSDLHSFSATRIAKLMTGDENSFIPPKELEDGTDNPDFKPEHNELRNKSKQTSFGIAYGKGIKGFSEDFGCPENEAEDFVNGYLAAFPGLPEYFEWVKERTYEQGYILIDDVSGRRWFSDDFAQMQKFYDEGMIPYKTEEYKAMPRDVKEAWKAKYKEENPWFKQIWREWAVLRGRLGRRSLNFPIQGCLPLSSKILTPDGWKKLGDFECGTVWTGDSWAPARRIFRGKAPKIKLHLSDGREFVCDNRHKMLIKTNSPYPQWCHVDNIIGKELIRDGGYTTDWGIDYLSVEDWYWFGRLVGDGWLQKNGKWGIIFNKDEFDALDKFCKWLDSKNIKSQWGEGYSIDYSCKGKYTKLREEATVGNVRISAKDAYRIFEAWHIDKGFSDKKVIPDVVYTLDRERRMAILKGWYNADGRRYKCKGGITIDKDQYTRLTCKDRDLLQQFSQLCQTLEITGSIGKELSKVSKKGTISKWSDFNFHTVPAPVIVEAIEEFGYEEDMYTLSVDDPRHSFSNEGFISKNTAGSQTKFAACMLRHEEITNKLPISLCNMIHDEVLVINTDLTRGAEMGKIVQRCMEMGGNKFCQQPLMSAGYKIGDHWLH